jgi:hypothetical protein
MRIEINTLTKAQIESKLKDIEVKLSEQLNKYLDRKFKEKEEEKSMLEKQAIKKQSETADKPWNKVKDLKLRLSEIESSIANIEENQKEFLKSFNEKFNEMVDKFNNHIKEGLVKR